MKTKLTPLFFHHSYTRAGQGLARLLFLPQSWSADLVLLTGYLSSAASVCRAVLNSELRALGKSLSPQELYRASLAEIG